MDEPRIEQPESEQVGAPAQSGHHGAIIAVMAAILIVAAGGLAFTIRTSSVPKVPPPSIQPPSPEQVEATREREQAQTLDTARQAIATGDEKGCSSIADAAQRASCEGIAIGGLAASTDDPALCDRAPDEYWKTACLDHVTAYRAVVQQKPSICDAMIVKERIPSCKAQAAPKE